MTRYIIFKNGAPWRCYFGELEFINGYSQLYDEFIEDPDKDWLSGTRLATTVDGRFFRTYQPAVFDGKRYKSLFEDFILGNEERNEAPLVTGMEFEELLEKSQKEFWTCNERFKRRLERLNFEQKFIEPMWTQRRGTSNLSLNPLFKKGEMNAYI